LEYENPSRFFSNFYKINALVYADKGKVNEIFTWVFIFQRYGKFLGKTYLIA